MKTQTLLAASALALLAFAVEAQTLKIAVVAEL